VRTPCRTCGRMIVVEAAPGAPAGDDVPLPAWFPFCSERCKMADLGRWFAEDYKVGGHRADVAAPDDDAE
jgi:endogenous inhibitor of DNA gyrase (YacG/DUF329 family)